MDEESKVPKEIIPLVFLTAVDSLFGKNWLPEMAKKIRDESRREKLKALCEEHFLVEIDSVQLTSFDHFSFSFIYSPQRANKVVFFYRSFWLVPFATACSPLGVNHTIEELQKAPNTLDKNFVYRLVWEVWGEKRLAEFREMCIKEEMFFQRTGSWNFHFPPQ